MITPGSDTVIQKTDIEEARLVNSRIQASAPLDIGTPELVRQAREFYGTPSVRQGKICPIELTIDGEGGPVGLRIMRPKVDARAVFFSVHGGGWCFGSPHQDDEFNEGFVLECGVAALSVDYRLAPEDPHPAAVSDCRAAFEWLVNNGEREFGTDKIAIGGASAGGHLAAETLLFARDQLDVMDRVTAANFVYGVFDVSGTPSQRRATSDTLGLNSNRLADYARHAFGSDLDRHDPEVSPIYADLGGLPPALFSVGDLDPLLDDSLFMATRWRAAGGRAEVDIWPECGHGFLVHMEATGGAARRRMHEWLNSHLAG